MIALAALAKATLVHAAGVYVYVDPAGNRLITDHRRLDLGDYKLLKKYTADDYFGTPYRPTTRRPLVPRASRFDQLIQAKAEQFGLEPALLKAVVQVESSFDPQALSPKGAKGLMQLMPVIATKYGVKQRADPIESLDAGGRHLKHLLSKFADTRLALAAYNAGEKAVLKYNGIPPYRETEDYVKKVLQLRQLYRRAAYQLELSARPHAPGPGPGTSIPRIKPIAAV